MCKRGVTVLWVIVDVHSMIISYFANKVFKLRDNITQEEKSFVNLRCINWCLLKVYPLTLVPDQGIWVTPYFPTHLNQALDLCQGIFLKGHLQYWNMSLSDPAWYHAGQKHKDVRLSMFLRFSILPLNTFKI